MSDRTLIVGGGIIGMMTARELHAAGHDVTLIERQALGKESSWAGGGILSPLFPWRYLDSITRLASWSQANYPELCEKLHRDSGIDPQFTQSGMLMVAPDEIATATDWAEQHQRELHLIDSAEYAKLEPQVAQQHDNALWMPSVGQVRNPRLAQSLAADIQRRGVTIHTDSPITDLLIEQDRCVGVKTATHTFNADNVVIAAGAWSGQLLAEHTLSPTVRPIRGQMILFKTKPGTLTRIMLEAQRYLIPRRDGHVLFGSSMEDVGFDKSTTQEMHDELFEIVTERFPVLKNAPLVKHWSGLRPSSPAGVPYIAQHPEIAQLYINAGQFRNGVVLGAASARLMSDVILQRTPIVDPKPYGWTTPRG
jgi:glycine oxidase